MFSPFQLDVIEFCARECSHQQSGEMSVLWMIDTYTHAYNVFKEYTPPRRVNLEFIYALGRMVEPKKNLLGLRWQDVSIKGNIITSKNLKDNVKKLLIKQSQLTPDEFYKQFEILHPFVDGNGRTGAILHNYLTGKIATKPEFPPNFWD